MNPACMHVNTFTYIPQHTSTSIQLNLYTQKYINIWLWPKRPPLAFYMAEMSVAEMSWPKCPWPKRPWPKYPTFDTDTRVPGPSTLQRIPLDKFPSFTQVAIPFLGEILVNQHSFVPVCLQICMCFIEIGTCMIGRKFHPPHFVFRTVGISNSLASVNVMLYD